MVLVYSACVNDTEPLSVLMMDSIILLILSFYSCNVFYLRDAASLKIVVHSILFPWKSVVAFVA